VKDVAVLITTTTIIIGPLTTKLTLRTVVGNLGSVSFFATRPRHPLIMVLPFMAKIFVDREIQTGLDTINEDLSKININQYLGEGESNS
jgi:hypothetical protein